MKEAIEMIKKMVADGQVSQEVAEKYFPELKESEDEKIRKTLKEYFINSFQNNGVAAILGVHINEILAWLEEQGTKLSAYQDALFKIATILSQHEDKEDSPLEQIRSVVIDGSLSAMDIEKQGEQKPADETPYPETLEKAIDLYYYSYGNGEGEFEHLSLEKFRDIVHTFVSDYGQKPAWSEEDEKELDRVIYMMEQLNLTKSWDDCYNFLNSLKDRVQPQTKQEWSEEDEEMYARIVRSYTSYEGRILGAMDLSEDNRNNILKDLNEQELWIKDRLKSLKERYTWKPSDEQMVALRRMKAAIAGEGEIYKPLNSLYEDLKKL